MKTDFNHLGESVDRLVTLDVRGRGAIYGLYQAARKRVNDSVTLSAGRKIVHALNSDDTVIIATGFRVLPQMIQETDGPLGAAALAKCFIEAFNATPIIIIEEDSKEIMASALRALEIKVEMDRDQFKPETEDSVLILGFPLKLKKANVEAKEILWTYKPSTIIAVEKAGRNVKGEYHTMNGVNVSCCHAKIEPLIEEARGLGTLTVGIGDGGNEVGMGNLRDDLDKLIPHSRLCRCPCEAGIVADSEVEILVPASISNWGAYGIEACVAALTGKPRSLHTAEEEERMIRALQNAGAVDGITGKAGLSVDGVPMKVHASVVNILEALIER